MDISWDDAQTFLAVVEALGPELEDRGIRVEHDLGPGVPPIDGDLLLLEELLTNLVRNAVDALGQDGRVRLSARLQGNHVVLAVEDDGPGIAPELLE